MALTVLGLSAGDCYSTVESNHVLWTVSFQTIKLIRGKHLQLMCLVGRETFRVLAGQGTWTKKKQLKHHIDHIFNDLNLIWHL